MGREKQRVDGVGETATPPGENRLDLKDRDEARKQLLQRLDSDEPLVDIDTSEDFDFANSLRSDFKSHIE